MSTKVFSEFKDKLVQYCAQNNIAVDVWRGGNRRNPKILELSSTSQTTILYVEDAFWGVTKSQLEAIVAAEDNCFVVLLIGSADNGYTLTARQVQEQDWSSSRYGTEYKIRHYDLSGNDYFLRFYSFDDFFHSLPIVHTEETPKAIDFLEVTDAPRISCQTYRILRDTELARQLKTAYRFKCQICGTSVQLYGRRWYAEAHHIKPLESPHNGPDIDGNILCVCPNHHAQLDYGAIKLSKEELDILPQHNISDEYIHYHNMEIYGKVGPNTD